MVINTLLRLGTTDADRTRIEHWTMNSLLRLGTTDRTQISRLPNIVFCYLKRVRIERNSV